MPTLSNEELKLAILKLVIKNSSYMTGSAKRDAETVEAILALFATQNTALLDSLIDEEVKLYNIYKDPVISVGIKIMADAVRELYDRTSE
jgi:hypothetical protein